MPSLRNRTRPGPPGGPLRKERTGAHTQPGKVRCQKGGLFRIRGRHILPFQFHLPPPRDRKLEAEDLVLVIGQSNLEFSLFRPATRPLTTRQPTTLPIQRIHPALSSS
ncbi:hypothetical protein VTJ04DRAFT_606 [Mycothermus thermophilus]|uniref:uncharacterized protein n=1 Tax=Humicola insolens TaxID=85995 RepID=UPI0037433B8C